MEIARKIALLGIVLLALWPGWLHGEGSSWRQELRKVKLDDLVFIDSLHPMQEALGMKQVKTYIRRMKRRKKAGNLDDGYLRKNPDKAVIGPGGQMYITDGHHFSRALYEVSGQNGEQEIYVIIEADLSGLSKEEFEKEVTKPENNWVYLKDENGKPIPFSKLPKHIRDLKNDRYRSLSWIVKKANGYDTPDQNFLEFKWADFFRDRIKFHRKHRWARALRKALKLAGSREASDLPGWKERESKVPRLKKCRKLLDEILEK